MNILQNDIKHTLNGLTTAERAKFNGSTVLITGCAGFLGYYMMHPKNLAIGRYIVVGIGMSSVAIRNGNTCAQTIVAVAFSKG